jgi:hypothetical protein
MSDSRKRIIIIITIIALFIILIGIIFAINSGNINSTKDPSITNIYVDPGSGETVYSTPNKTSEKAGGSSVVILGLSKLLDIGITSNQIIKLRTYFSNYASAQNPKITEISITVASIKRTINNGEVTLDFTITINRGSTMNAKIIYNNINDLNLKLYKVTDNSLVYSS